jgi:hypothetical protein
MARAAVAWTLIQSATGIRQDYNKNFGTYFPGASQDDIATALTKAREYYKPLRRAEGAPARWRQHQDAAAAATAMEDTGPTIPRWRMTVSYLDDPRPGTFAFEELAEVDGLIERGPDWNLIDRITIRLARDPDGELRPDWPDASCEGDMPVEYRRRVVDHFFDAERKDFIGNPAEDHIFHSIAMVRSFLPPVPPRE